MARHTRTLPEQLQAPGFAMNLDAPTIAAQQRTQRSLRRIVKATVFVGIPVALLTSVAAIYGALSPETESAAPSSVSVNQSVGKAAATLAVTEWLATAPAPLPGGMLVSWDGFTITVPPPPTQSDAAPLTYVKEHHRFTVTDGSVIYDVEVLVHADEVLGAKVIGTPSLMPRPLTGDTAWSGEVPWFGYVTATTQADIDTAVTAWVAAFTSGSPKTLKQQIGDPEKARSFVPLTGVASATGKISVTGMLPHKADEPAPSSMLARVEVSLTWAGQPSTTTRGTVVTYDLLIVGVDTATPRVVSWGGPGSGPTLTPYSVGLTGISLREPSSSPATDPTVTVDEHDEETEDG